MLKYKQNQKARDEREGHFVMTGTQGKCNIYKELSEIIKNPEFLNSEGRRERPQKGE